MKISHAEWLHRQIDYRIADAQRWTSLEMLPQFYRQWSIDNDAAYYIPASQRDRENQGSVWFKELLLAHFRERYGTREFLQ